MALNALSHNIHAQTSHNSVENINDIKNMRINKFSETKDRFTLV